MRAGGGGGGGGAAERKFLFLLEQRGACFGICLSLRGKKTHRNFLCARVSAPSDCFLSRGGARNSPKLSFDSLHPLEEIEGGGVCKSDDVTRKKMESRFLCVGGRRGFKARDGGGGQLTWLSLLWAGLSSP